MLGREPSRLPSYKANKIDVGLALDSHDSARVKDKSAVRQNQYSAMRVRSLGVIGACYARAVFAGEPRSASSIPSSPARKRRCQVRLADVLHLAVRLIG